MTTTDKLAAALRKISEEISVIPRTEYNNGRQDGWNEAAEIAQEALRQYEAEKQEAACSFGKVGKEYCATIDDDAENCITRPTPTARKEALDRFKALLEYSDIAKRFLGFKAVIIEAALTEQPNVSEDVPKLKRELDWYKKRLTEYQNQYGSMIVNLPFTVKEQADEELVNALEWAQEKVDYIDRDHDGAPFNEDHLYLKTLIRYCEERRGVMDNVTEIPVRFKNPAPDGRILTIAVGVKCIHGPFIVDDTLETVECQKCKERLSPMHVLKMLAREETRWHEFHAHYEEEKKRLSERQRTKCEHCKEMTRISK